MNLNDVLSMLSLVRCHWLSFNVRFNDMLLLRIIDVMFMVCDYAMYDVLKEIL